MRTRVWARSKIKSPSLLSRKDQGKPDTLLAFTTKSVCCYVCPGGSRKILEPAIKRVELRIKSSVLDTCLLHDFITGQGMKWKALGMQKPPEQRRIEELF